MLGTNTESSINNPINEATKIILAPLGSCLLIKAAKINPKSGNINERLAHPETED